MKIILSAPVILGDNYTFVQLAVRNKHYGRLRDFWNRNVPIQSSTLTASAVSLSESKGLVLSHFHVHMLLFELATGLSRMISQQVGDFELPALQTHSITQQREKVGKSGH